MLSPFWLVVTRSVTFLRSAAEKYYLSPELITLLSAGISEHGIGQLIDLSTAEVPYCLGIRSCFHGTSAVFRRRSVDVP